MAEWFVGAIMEKLIGTCSEYLQEIKWETGMEEELERLRRMRPHIQAVISVASQAQMTDPNSEINKWIWQLRDAIDEADDVLDDFECMKHKEQLARNMARSTMSLLKKIGKRAFKIDPNLKRLLEIVQKLDKISAGVSTFLHILEKTISQDRMAQQHALIRETGWPKNELFVRNKEKELVIQWLMKPQNEEHQSHVPETMYNNISLLSIEGSGGMGKTTLLQHVYKEITNEFDLKMWVCVSYNFDVKEVIKSMLASLTEIWPSLESLDALQNILRLKVMSKKFLLVLDDIWEENEEIDKWKWKRVLAPLTYGGLGSKILITTRMNSAALVIAKVINKQYESLILKDLENDECLQLLNTYAFANVENLNDYKNLRSIAEDLAKRLFGSPLAAKVIGGVLNSNLDERHWKYILNHAIDSGAFPILKLSYTMLPEYLQNCFAFCSIFARDHVFDKDSLVQMWIAVGFIQPSNIPGQDLEDIGGTYIDMLVKKSLFEKDKSGYKIHGLLHELAQSVSAQECFRIVSDENLALDNLETIRHLFVETTNLELLKKIGKFKNLRTLCISYANDSQPFDDVLTKIFEEIRSIRLLSIDTYHREMKPKIFRGLKHLRYLEIKFYADFRLPISVSDLYHLQFLLCRRIYDIPKDMNNLPL